jgi:L-fuculose-phosphate aldolase
MSDKGLKYPVGKAEQIEAASGSNSSNSSNSIDAEQDYFGTSFDALLETFSAAPGNEFSETAAASRISISVIGWVRSSLHKLEGGPLGNAQAPEAVLEILPDFVPGLDGLKPGLTITVLTWSHLSGRKDLHMPETAAAAAKPGGRGVFAGRGPDRPNPVVIHQTVIQDIEKQAAAALIRVNSLEALDGTPILDIKYDFLAEQGIDEDLTAFKKNLVNLCARAHTHGLLNGFNGNASLRRGDLCIITGSGTAKGTLGLTDFATLDITGGRIMAGKSASTEAAMHLQIYRNQPGAKVILHTHPTKLLALSLNLPGLPMQERLKMPITESESERFCCATVGPFSPGSDELALAVAQEAKSRQAVWMEGHGLCVWGSDAAEVLGLSEELEHLACVRLLSGSWSAKRDV